MRYETVTRRVGEYLGPVDWEYDFRSHFDGYGSNDEARDAACERAIGWLRKLSGGGEWEATTDGGCPKFGWGKVLEVGMYDGWPYWRPVPSVAIAGTLGVAWHSFDSITGISELTADMKSHAKSESE